jgi:hypothetical protein
MIVINKGRSTALKVVGLTVVYVLSDYEASLIKTLNSLLLIYGTDDDVQG